MADETPETEAAEPEAPEAEATPEAAPPEPVLPPKEARTAGEGTPAAERVAGNPQVRVGKVVSDNADKTITVRIEVVRRHRRYGKVIRSTSTMHAHDERNDAHQGDLVRVVESRPLSRTKRWRLVEVLERAK